MTSILIASSLRRTFGSYVAIDDFDLTVDEGTIVGLIGPSGGGKTTAVRLLAGIDEPDSGSVEVFGSPVRSLRRKDRARMAILAQDPALVPQLTIHEQVSFAAELRGLRRDVQEALARVGLDESVDTRLSDASGGMRRRAGLAATLITDPDLVFCDEPTAGLDPIVRETVWSWFRERRRAGRTMVVTTQHIDEAARCDRVLVLRTGAIIADTTPSQLTAESGLREHIVIELVDNNAQLAIDALKRRGLSAEFRAGHSLVVEARDSADTAGTIVSILADEDVVIDAVDTAVPGLDDVFRALVEKS